MVGEYLHSSLKECIDNGDHLINCDEDGYCNFCGEDRMFSQNDFIVSCRSRKEGKEVIAFLAGFPTMGGRKAFSLEKRHSTAYEVMVDYDLFPPHNNHLWSKEKTIAHLQGAAHAFRRICRGNRLIRRTRPKKSVDGTNHSFHY